MSVGVRRLAGQGLEFAIVFVVYATTARLGLSFDALGGIASAVWPPTGIALAALSLRGLRLWPAVFVAAFAVNATTGIPIWSAGLIALGNTLEAVIGAALLRRLRFDSRIERLRDVLLLVGVAALGSTTVSATCGLVAAALGRVPMIKSAPAFWTVWWVGDVLGDLLIAPLIFVWATTPRLSRRPRRWIEAALLLGAVALVSVVFFRHALAYQAIHGLVRGTYPIVPVLIWAALRFEQRGVTSALVLVAAIAVSGAATGGGIFSTESTQDRLLLVQGFMAVTAVSMLTLGAALAERRAAVGARDEFISIASHELKTPLTALQIELYGLLESNQKAMDERAGRKLARASRNADRLSRLIELLLDVSRIATGRMALRPERFDLWQALELIADTMRETALKAGSVFSLEGAGPILGRWDRLRVEQVAMNLLSNAFKYGAGHPVVLSASIVDGQAVIEVRDEGPGVPENDLERIFNRFERAAPMRNHGGLGLGLYVSREIAGAHRGSITVRNLPQGGAAFTVRLPIEAEA